jgi:seryl-tRNA synthetase
VLDIKRIRDEREVVKAALARRDPALSELVEEIARADEQWRAATSAAEALRAQQREHSERVAQGKRAGSDVSAQLAQLKQMSAEVKALGEQAGEARSMLDEQLLRLPNLPDPTAAPGPQDELLRVVGEIKVGVRRSAGAMQTADAGAREGADADAEEGADADAQSRGAGAREEADAEHGKGGEGDGFGGSQSSLAPRDHLELAGAMIDVEHAARLSGTRFAYLLGDLVLVELALVHWVLQKLRGHGFQPVIPPVLVRERALFGTGFLPDTEQQIYRLPEDDLYLVGTSEVALASLHDEEIIELERLPLRYAGFSPCFRREAGAAGKDTHGIFRVHQFDKVEMFSFVAPEDAHAEHERILAIEEEILGELGLPYRVMNIAVTDLGNSAAKKYDCEAWLPSQGRYRELTSCSNTSDYQARRLDIRLRRAAGERPEILHTLNGTAVAVGRTLIALLENGQREDGSVGLPECLIAYGAPAELPVA